jgi:hypothetical protein
VLSEADRPLVAVLRQVSNDKNGHGGSTKIRSRSARGMPAENPNSA